ncbi:MAG: DUF349 domain-containing protein [Gammaproteobacteria bacterium]|nr:DUF349 domain-containing protein [Gammaproteobacteria bacterium]MCF6363767.1 DUF349 domain-containing protein [Gammaproteobacteria bacterium]
MLSRLFAPKWKHPKPTVRQEAVKGLPDDAQAVFRQVAEEDTDAVIRRLALRRLSDLQQVQALCTKAGDDADRRTAEQHLTHLLAGKLVQGPSLAERWQFLEGLSDEHWFERILKEGQESELRRQVLQRVSRQSLLGDVALMDDDASVRHAAATKLTQRSTLERVAKSARRHDKRVYQCVRDALAVLDAADSRPREMRAQADKLNIQLQALLKAAQGSGNWGRIEDSMRGLQRQWAALDLSLLEQVEVESFQQGIDRFDFALQDWREREQQQAREHALRQAKLTQAEAICAQLASLLETLRVEGRVRDMATVNQACDVCTRSWRDLDLPDDSDGQALVLRYDTLQAALAQVLEDETLLVELTPRLEALQQAVQALLSQASVTEPALRKLESQWQAFPRPVQLTLDGPQATAIGEGLHTLQERLRRQQQQQQANAGTLQEMVARLEQHLREQTYKPAFVLAQKAQQVQDSLSVEMQRKLEKSAVLKRLHKVQIQLREMRDWRNFANAPVMEQLCGDMERLADEMEAGGDVDLSDGAARVRSARVEWKKMTEAQGTAPKALWRRFDAACSRAYAPCQAHFETQGAQRDENLQYRQSVCQGLEDYARKVGAQVEDDADWPALEQIVKTADREWRGLGAVPRQQQKAINRRFRKVMDRLRALAHKHREHNHVQKAERVKQAERLQQRLAEGHEELPVALEKAKALQAEWKQIGPASKDGELWRRFHAACDAIFTERKRERAAHNEATHEQVGIRRQICEQIEMAASAHGDEFRLARHAVDAANAQWQAAGHLPKREMDRLERRYRAACGKFEQRLQAERQAQREQAQQCLRDKAALCQSLEWLADQQLATGRDVTQLTAEREALSHQFDALAEVPGAMGKGVAARYRRALAWLDRLVDKEADLAALQAELTAEREAATQHRLELCLQLEIAAGIESPADYRQARLAYQVALLAEQMKSGLHPSLDEQLQGLSLDWYATAAAEESRSSDISERFESLLQTAGGRKADA